MNHVGELYWVPDEEEGRVVSYEIVNTFLSVGLNGETTRVTICICDSTLSQGCRESHTDGGTLADAVQELGFGVLGHVMGNLKISKTTSSNCMYYSLRDSLPVKFGQFVNQVQVGKDDGASLQQ